MQSPLDVFETSESFMGQQGLPEEPSVDPRNLTLNQADAGGSGFTQDFGNLAGNHLQPGFDAGVYSESYPTEFDYISPSYPNSSQVDSGEVA